MESPEKLPSGTQKEAGGSSEQTIKAFSGDAVKLGCIYSRIDNLGGGNSKIFGIFTPKIGEDFHFD